MQSEAEASVNITGAIPVQTDSTVLTGEESASIVEGTSLGGDGGSLPSETPDKILGKFNTQEDLLKAYQALEAKLGGGQESPQVTEEPEPVAEVPTSVVEEYANKIMEAGGNITPEIYQELEGKGYSKEFVDTYVQGVKTQEQTAFNNLVSDIGGVEAYQAAAQWAQANMTQAQLVAYNKSLDSAEPEVAKIIMGSLITKSQTNTAQPTAAPLHTNTPLQVQTVGVYENKSDYETDANDPRYHKDPAYRNKVEQKLGKTDMSTWYKHLSNGY